MLMRPAFFKSVSLILFLALSMMTGAGYAKQAETISIHDLAPTPQQTQLDYVISELLTHVHYSHNRLDDAMSSTILDEYLDMLDFNRSYFLASDIKQFEQYRTALDDGLRSGDLKPVYRIFNIYQRRIVERTARIHEQLRQPVDFTVNESMELDRKATPWARSGQELDEVWRKRLKSELLTLTLAGKDLDGARKLLEKRYENRLRRGAQTTPEDVFQLYMNAVARSFDPHTAYMSPRSSDDFDIQMRLSLEGIGAVLRSEEENVQIVELVPGGPADLSKQLKPNDRIIGVAQGDDGPMVDVIGWRLEDVVDLIRGPRGSVVRLEVVPTTAESGATNKTVRLVRNQIQLEEQAAKSAVKTIQDKERSYRVGVITIPGFYVDFAAAQRGDADYRSTTRDVQRLLEQLKREKVDGVVIDLRRNGGGSLKEVVKLTGLFIKDGPVVQVRDAKGEVTQETDTDPTVVYDGPLAVLVDRFSASASEIFAGAIQDYGRGLVIGDRTFGKGTVQTLIDLDRFLPKKETAQAGQLRLTIAKFYRVNGSSTQHRGVVPDIRFPTAFGSDEVGESAEKYALPWDEIAATRYQSNGWIPPALVQELERRHATRIAADPEFRDYLDDVAMAQQVRQQKTISLQQAKRKAEQEQLRAKQRERENRRRIAQGLKPLGENEEIPESKDGPDPLLDESVHIVADVIRMANRTDGLAMGRNAPTGNTR